MTRTHLILALGGVSWGETSFGVRIGRELHERGDTVTVVAHAAFRTFLIGLAFRVEFVSSDADLHRVVTAALDPKNNLSSIVLADSCIATEVLEAAGIDTALLFRSRARVIGVDTWDYEITGDTIDLAFGRTRIVKDALSEPAQRLLPAPLLHPEGRATRCRTLSSSLPVAEEDRRRLKASLGLRQADRVVLVCTAPWQVEKDDSDAGVPALVSAYLAQLDEDVHVVHVGPQASALGRYLGTRYHWQPSLTPARFDLLMGSVDLLLSLNVSATTIGRAISARVPTLVLQSSVEAATPDAAVAALGGARSKSVRRWCDVATVIPRFRVWPLGHFDYLAPVVDRNPYVETFLTCELFDQQGVVGALQRLISDAGSRDALRHRQEAYIARLESLPTPAEAIMALVAGSNGDRRVDATVRGSRSM